MLVLNIEDLEKVKTNESRVLSIHEPCLINSRIMFCLFVVWLFSCLVGTDDVQVTDRLNNQLNN